VGSIATRHVPRLGLGGGEHWSPCLSGRLAAITRMTSHHRRPTHTTRRLHHRTQMTRRLHHRTHMTRRLRRRLLSQWCHLLCRQTMNSNRRLLLHRLKLGTLTRRRRRLTETTQSHLRRHLLQRTRKLKAMFSTAPTKSMRLPMPPMSKHTQMLVTMSRSMRPRSAQRSRPRAVQIGWRRLLHQARRAHPIMSRPVATPVRRRQRPPRRMTPRGTHAGGTASRRGAPKRDVIATAASAVRAVDQASHLPALGAASSCSAARPSKEARASAKRGIAASSPTARRSSHQRRFGR